MSEYGIDYEPNECSKYLLMPRNQNFNIQELTKDKITGYEASYSLKEDQANFEYETTGDLNLMKNKKVPFVGSLTSIMLETAFSIWVLEHDD